MVIRSPKRRQQKPMPRIPNETKRRQKCMVRQGRVLTLVVCVCLLFLTIRALAVSRICGLPPLVFDEVSQSISTAATSPPHSLAGTTETYHSKSKEWGQPSDRTNPPDTTAVEAVPEDEQSLASFQTKSPPYAYVFMMWGTDPYERTLDYTGTIAGMLVAVKQLRDTGSTADFIFMIRPTQAEPLENGLLPPEDERILKAAGVQIRILSPEPDYMARSWRKALYFHKFELYRLVEYRRVTFLDPDILPVANLDYLMKESEPGGSLQPNVVVATQDDPANAGLFVVAPDLQMYATIQNKINETGRYNLNDRAPFWNKTLGWGHVIDPASEPWDTNKNKTGNLWDMFGGEIDQGLLYYLCVYELDGCSRLLSHKVYHYTSRKAAKGAKLDLPLQQLQERHVKVVPIPSSIDESPFRWQREPQLFTKRSLDKEKIQWCPTFTGKEDLGEAWPGCIAPWSDFDHLWACLKPWRRKCGPRVWPLQSPALYSFHHWFLELANLTHTHQLDRSWFQFELPTLPGNHSWYEAP